jgi:DNA-binding NarL/FixJ family response regulator
MRFLLVDDHPLVRQGLREVLKQLDPDVEIGEAEDAAAARRLASDDADLDLILLDLALPDDDGLSLLTEFRRDHADVPVVVLSASTEAREVMQCIRLGAAGFIPKTSGAGVMLAALRLVLSGGIYLPPDILLAQGVLRPGAHRMRLRPRRDGDPTRLEAAELGLSDRQAQVLALLVQGKSNKMIGRELDIAEQTVKAHISAVLRALNVTTRAEAAHAVAELGIDLDRYRTPAEPPRPPRVG